jgi:hypothetical protein
MGHAGDRGQALAAEPVGGHLLEVAQLAQLRGGCPLQGAPCVLRSPLPWPSSRRGSSPCRRRRSRR